MRVSTYAIFLVVFACYTSAATVETPTLRPTVLRGPSPCVTPSQWEGRFSEWDHDKAVNNRYLISFDGVKKRKYVEEERKSMIPGRRLFKFLVFHDEKVEYKIDETFNRCTKIPMGPWRNFSIPVKATFEDEYQIGGPSDTIDVTEWSDRQPSRSKETWIGGYTKLGCWPVFEIFTMKNNTASIDMTTRFFDITSGIKNISVFDVPEICKQATVDDEDRPGLLDKLVNWLPGWAKSLFGVQKIDQVTASES